jgi:dihydropyrimidinase
MAILIKGGRVVTAADDYVADVWVDGETVGAIGASLSLPADEVIDARGKYVLPGGIDPHTHLEMPFGGTVSCDDFTSGTAAAAFGGTTTVVDFCMQQKGQRLPEALAGWHAKLAAHPPIVDVGFHMAVTDLSYDGALEDLAGMPARGVPSYKLFMAYKGAIMADDGTLFRSMRAAAASGALVMVHAENGDVIDVLVREALAAGHTEPVWHARTRPVEAEGEATGRAIQLARIAGCPLYVVHVSCEPALQPLREARSAGWAVWGETCPQYLLIDETALEGPGFEGAKYVYTPPPRAREHQAHLWEGLATGVLSVVSTDHCPFDWATQKALGRDDFTKIPNGGPGIESRLLVLYQAGVATGRLSLRRFVDLVSTSPARLFGLFPKKGTVAVGSDADLVIWDPAGKTVLSAATHHSRVDYDLYEGMEVDGAVETVLSRGAVVVREGELVAGAGHGRFVERLPFSGA